MSTTQNTASMNTGKNASGSAVNTGPEITTGKNASGSAVNAGTEITTGKNASGSAVNAGPEITSTAIVSGDVAAKKATRRPTVKRTNEMEPGPKVSKKTENMLMDAKEAKNTAKQRMDELKETSEKLKDLEDKLPEYYLGQGAVYVIEDQNMTLQNDVLVANGPEFVRHQWNMRPTLQSNIDGFFKMTDNGKLLAPMRQEHALFFAVSPGLVDVNSLDKYQSGKFPPVKFRSKEGKLEVVAGHHRMMVLAKSNQELLRLKENYLKILSRVNKGKTNAQIIEDSKKELVTVCNQLWDNGRWGVVFLDYDKIMQSQEREKIKLYFSRNMSVFNLADSLNDTLHMLLISVQGLCAQEAMEFIHSELTLRSTNKDRASINNVANNPESILIFSQLLAIPMLRQTPIVNFTNLYNWRKMTRTWLDHFLSFAVISFEYLGLEPSNKIGAEFFETAAIGKNNANFEFLDIDLLDILESNYRLHLSKEIIVMGRKENMVIDGDISHNWEESYKSYKKGVLKDVEEWVEKHVQVHMASEENRNLKWIQCLEERIKVLLNSASSKYPFIRALDCSIPVFCPAFLIDVAFSIQENEAAFIEFFTLFDPYVATRFGDNKAVHSPLRIDEMFRFFATVPKTRIATESNLIKKVPDPSQSIEKLWALPFLARQTAINLIGTMIPNMKSRRWPKPKEYKPSKGENVQIPDEHILPYSLTSLLVTWTKNQRTSEMKLDRKSLPADVQEYLSKKTNGCAFPPAKGFSPTVPSEATVSVSDCRILESCLEMASHSSMSWARHSSNARQGMHSRAVGFLATHYETEIYQAYLGQNIVWSLYSEMVTILEEISENWTPWHQMNDDNRIVSDHQLLEGVRVGVDLDPIVGVAIAQSAADVDEKYRKGLASIWKIVQNMCGIDMVDSDDEMGTATPSTRKIGSAVCIATQDFFQVLANESAQARYQFDHEHIPHETMRQSTSLNILKERLGWEEPSDDLIISNNNRSIAYGSKGLEELLKTKVNKLPTARQEDVKTKREEKAEEARNKRTEKRMERRRVKESVPRSSKKRGEKVRAPSVVDSEGEGDYIPTARQEARNKKDEKRMERKKVKGVTRSSKKREGMVRARSVDSEGGEDNTPQPNQLAESSKKRAHYSLDDESQPLAKKIRTYEEDYELDYEPTSDDDHDMNEGEDGNDVPSPPGL